MVGVRVKLNMNLNQRIFRNKIVFSAVMVLVFGVIAGGSVWMVRIETDSRWLSRAAEAADKSIKPLLPLTGGPIEYSLLSESGSAEESRNEYWWLNSGGLVRLNGSAGKTNLGDLATTSAWRLKYAESNPEDTDDGFHPQNLFRLLTQEKFRNQVQQGYFKILKNNLSQSEHREQSNGILLISRQRDGGNLYYAGLRVDGYAVIKKKVAGVYHTLALVPIYANNIYDREAVPNLLPTGKWLGLRSVVYDEGGVVTIALLIDREGQGDWQLVARVRDGGESGAPLLEAGRSGIRTDFMDVEFERYSVSAMPR